MFDEAHARTIAEGTLKHIDVALGEARELREGWFFPYRTARIGSHGVIVNKHTGRVFTLGSAFPVERDLALYDEGFQFEKYDLVVTAIHDLEKSRRALSALRLVVVEPEFEHGQVWRIPRPLTDLQLWSRLDKLPCVFPGKPLYFRLEILRDARRERWFDFEALEYRRRD